VNASDFFLKLLAFLHILWNSWDMSNSADTGRGTGTLKRSRDEDDCDDGGSCESEDSQGFTLTMPLAFLVGKDWCRMEDLIRSGLQGYLDTDAVTKVDEWIKVTVTGLSGGTCETINLPSGEGFSSIWHVKEEISKLFGVEEKLQLLCDADADVDEDICASDVLLMDAYVLHKKECGSMSWNFNMLVCQCCQVYKWEEPDEAKGRDHFRVLADGLVYSPMRDLHPRQDPLFQRVGVVPTIIPAVRMGHRRVGVYVISFAVKYSDDDSLDLTCPLTPDVALRLTSGCYIGLAEVGLDDTQWEWKIDVSTGTVSDPRNEVFLDTTNIQQFYTDFLHPGHVLTLKMDCTEGRLTFFRDGDECAHLFVAEYPMVELQFVAHIPIAGFDVVIVDDPVLRSGSSASCE
jgi:hypothetical protein